jgi:hypothetical protein
MDKDIKLIVNKFTSRKFLAFGISTILLCVGVIDPTTWMIVTSAFMGIEGILDLKSR